MFRIKITEATHDNEPVCSQDSLAPHRQHQTWIVYLGAVIPNSSTKRSPVAANFGACTNMPPPDADAGPTQELVEVTAVSIVDGNGRECDLARTALNALNLADIHPLAEPAANDDEGGAAASGQREGLTVDEHARLTSSNVG
jgi:hypothetical protein